MKKLIELKTAREVMEALLNGDKVAHTGYGIYESDGIYLHDEELYIYISNFGDLCEEDGAGCKQHRFPICFRSGEKWFKV